MRICVIGAGISGLTIGKLLSKYFDVEVLEKDSTLGGIAKTKNIRGVPYHLTGGHCFNSKYPEVLEFVFSNVLDKSKWNKIKRNAGIRFKGSVINYPIEYSINEIYKLNPELAIDIVKDFMESNGGDSKNLKEWFINNFGKTLSNEYFIPYNRKIWNRDPAEMDPGWVKEKLPMPNKESFVRGLLGDGRDSMPHFDFYYPKGNDQLLFAKALSEGLNIKYNFKVESIIRTPNGFQLNDSERYDLVISTVPLNVVSNIASDLSPIIQNAALNLKYNKVTTMFWRTKPIDRTWTYIPESDIRFHRYIHIGNFLKPKVNNYSIAEAIGSFSFEELAEEGKKDDFLLEPLDHNISDHAYVVFDENYHNVKNAVLKELKSIGIYSLGRFGEWEYYNMDICIKSAMEMADLILKRYEVN